jgi:branched-chain amino acid transport system ATP-binding protein
VSAVLEVSGLEKQFVGLRAVNGVDFTVQPGEILAIIGPNGAGKTTVFNLIAGKLRPTAGTIRMQGEDITKLALRGRIRKGIVATFQVPRVLGELTVREIVALAVHYSGQGRNAVHGHVEELCARFDLPPDATAVSLDLHRLKKLEMARAVAVAPSVLLLDEVACGLDTSERDSISGMIRQLAEGGTSIIIVEHSMSFIQELCERAVVLSFGEVLTSGPVDEALSDPAVIEAYLGVS